MSDETYASKKYAIKVNDHNVTAEVSQTEDGFTTIKFTVDGGHITIGYEMNNADAAGDLVENLMEGLNKVLKLQMQEMVQSLFR